MKYIRVQRSWAYFCCFFLLMFFGFIGGVFFYPGSPLAFAIFTTSFFLFPILAFETRPSYGVLFFSSVLWIGFWLKMVLQIPHGLTGWGEPTGAFSGTPSAWDHVLIVSSSGAVGAFLSVLSWTTFLKSSGYSKKCVPASEVVSPKKIRWGFFLFAISLIFVTLFLNEKFDLIKLGYWSKIILPWPFQGVFSWWCNFGLAFFLAWHLGALNDSENGFFVRYLLVVASAIGVSVSMYSRGVYLFSVIPILIVIFSCGSMRRHLSSRMIFGILGTFVVGLLLSVTASQQMRDRSQIEFEEANRVVEGSAVRSEIPEAGSRISEIPVTQPQSLGKAELAFDLFRRLAINRWLGLEGVMAVASFPGINMKTFFSASLERRSRHDADFYTTTVSKSGFTASNAATRQYATMPGAIGFLYLSESLFVVFFGMFLFTTLVIAGERFVSWMLRSDFAAAAAGVYFSMLVVQLGAGGLGQPAMSYLTTIGFTIVLNYSLRFFLPSKVLIS